MSICYEINLDDEAELIEELNLMQDDWRDEYDTPVEAAEDLLPGWRSRYYRGCDGNEFEELNFEE